MKFDFEGQGQSPPKFNDVLTVIRCISAPNLVIVGQTGDELSDEQARKMAKFDFRDKFDLEGQGQSC